MVLYSYILGASGSVATPNLHIMIDIGDLEKAKKHAFDIVKRLSKADYYFFQLFDVDNRSVGIIKIMFSEPKIVLVPTEFT